MAKYRAILVLIFPILILSGLGSMVRIPPSLVPEITNSASLQPLEEFLASLPVADHNQVTGIFIPGVLAARVEQQPSGDPTFVHPGGDTLTQFSLADSYNTVGLITHAESVGAKFTQIKVGSQILIHRSTISFTPYLVTEIRSFRALSPGRINSSFQSLAFPFHRYSPDELFSLTFGRGNQSLVLQTCISTADHPNWGRLFIIAEPALEW